MCAWIPGRDSSVLKGVRITGFHYIGSSQSVTESVFVDEEELPVLAAGLREIVASAKPAVEVEFGDLGKKKVMATVKVTSIEGAAFTYDESLVGGYAVRIDGRGFQATKSEVFMALADRMDRAASLLKKLNPVAG